MSRTAFLQVDKQSGFNMLQAAVLEGKFDIVLEASGLFDNFVEEMKLTRTGKNAKRFPGKTAVDILSFSYHPHNHDIKRIYEKLAEDNSRLTECNDDAELAVERVLNVGVDINARTSDNDYTVLLQASRSSSGQYIETLIDLGADVKAQRRESKETPLMLAADCNNYMAASLPLRHGAGENVQDSFGSTPLHLSVKKNCKRLVRLLLAYDAIVNIEDNSGYTILHQSVLRGDKNLVRLFLEHHADVNTQNKRGETPLLLTVKLGHENLVRLSVEHNADVNIPDNDGYKLLQRYVMGGDENLIRFLVEHNADVNIQNKDGYTPLHRLVFKKDENRCRWLLEHNPDANIQDNNGYTPLHRAVMNGAVNLIGLLLQHKADVNIQHKFGFTPLHLSARFSHKDCNKIIDLLLQYGVQNIDIRDVEGRTPLQMAVRCGNAQAVKKLVDLGAEVSLVKADKKDAVELERLYYEAENVE